MTIPASGPVDFFQLKTEFKPSTSNTTSIGLNELYSGGSYVKGGGFLGIPTTGAIGINNLQGTYDRYMGVYQDAVSVSGGVGAYIDATYGTGINFITTDKFGNTYTAGVTLSKQYQYDASVIKKYNTSGTLLWAKHLLRPSDATYVAENGATLPWPQVGNDAGVRGMKMNSAGDAIYLCYPTLRRRSDGSSFLKDVVVSKMDLDGNILWSHQMSDDYYNADIIPRGLDVDSSDNVYVVSNVQNPLNGGTGVYLSVVLQKINSSGTAQWAKQSQFGDAGVQLLLNDALKVSPSGDIYVVSDGGQVFKWNTSGTLQWKKNTFGPNGVNTFRINALCLDSSENIYLTGKYYGVSNYDTEYAIVKLNSSGTVLNGYNITSSVSGFTNRQSDSKSIQVDADGNIYVSGTTASYTQTSTSYIFTDAWFTKLNSSFDTQWSFGIRTTTSPTSAPYGQKCYNGMMHWSKYTNNLHSNCIFMCPCTDDGYGSQTGLNRPGMIKMPSSNGFPAGSYTNAAISANTDGLPEGYIAQNITTSKTATTTTTATFSPSGSNNYTDATFTPFSTTLSSFSWTTHTPVYSTFAKI